MYAEKTAQQNTAQVEPRLPGLIRDIQGLGESAANLRSRLAELKDRAFGCEPEGKNTMSAPRPVPNGALDSLSSNIGGVSEILTECSNLLSRIEQMV